MIMLSSLAIWGKNRGKKKNPTSQQRNSNTINDIFIQTDNPKQTF
jgi:hypothetical protein